MKTGIYFEVMVMLRSGFVYVGNHSNGSQIGRGQNKLCALAAQTCISHRSELNLRGQVRHGEKKYG